MGGGRGVALRFGVREAGCSVGRIGRNGGGRLRASCLLLEAVWGVFAGVYLAGISLHWSQEL